MAAPLDVNREEYRMLVLELGYAETARRTGLKEGTLRQWGFRGGWLEHLRKKAQQPASTAKVAVTGVTKPADALCEMLAEDDKATRIGLSRATRKRVERLAKSSDPADAQDLLSLAKTAAVTHRWGDGSQIGVAVNILVSQ